MNTYFIKDPSPVWEQIKVFLVEDGGEYTKEGIFVGTEIDSKPAGAFLVKPWNNYCYELHGGIAPEFYGEAVKIFLDLGAFLFTYTPCMKIVTVIPSFNRLAISAVQRTGLTFEGKVKKSFMKRFKMWDQEVYGITKGEWRCLQQ